MTENQRMVKTSHGDIAIGESSGDGLAFVMLHGNSADRKVFAHQFQGELAEQNRLIAIDLPGHGQSSDATDPERTYTMTGYADAVCETLAEIGVDQAAVFGWSLGGHVGFEMVERFPGMVGLMISGTPPIGQTPEAVQAGFQPSPHAGLAGKPEFTPEEAAIFAFATYGDPQSPDAHQAIARTDGRARAVMFANLFTGGISDQRRIAETSTMPLAVVNGDADPLVNLDYVGSLSYASLWEDHCFVLRGAGHAPFMQAPDAFNPIFGRFCADMKDRTVATTSDLLVGVGAA